MKALLFIALLSLPVLGAPARVLKDGQERKEQGKPEVYRKLDEVEERRYLKKSQADKRVVPPKPPEKKPQTQQTLPTNQPIP
ncbi:MAG: hypothetical protein J0I12_30155 [Candidatus Eremiobacteraeota bacterium]|nr:hypothetical protein [Candidatus Eremiobacteraeota bacterium]